MDADYWTAVHLLSSVEVICLGAVNTGLYGISVTLYFFCVQQIYHHLKKGGAQGGAADSRSHIITLLHMTVVMVLGFVALAFSIRSIQLAYIDHADYPGGGFIWAADVDIRSGREIAGAVFGILIECLTLAIPIWRVWVVWSVSQYVLFIVSLPTLLALGYLALQLVLAVTVFVPIDIGQPGRLAVSISNDAVNLATNGVVTLLILVKIITVRRRSVDIMGQPEHSRQYTSVVAMLIESFALNCVWTLGVMISTAVDIHIPTPTTNAAELVFSASLHNVRILAYMLMLYRVITNRGWNKETERHLTTLQWNRSQAHTTTGISMVTASIPANAV